MDMSIGAVIRGAGRAALVLCIVGVTGTVVAEDGTSKVAFRAQPNAATDFRLAESHELVLSAPPREDEQVANAIYGPVAEHLSKALGKPVVFRHPGNWGVYQGLMQKGAYDVVFDGPHFNSWRADHTRHNVVVKVPGDHVFVVLVRKDNEKIRELRQLAGRTICAHAPPNLGTLTALNEFDNPARQPIIVNTDGWKDIYDGMVAGKCVAAVIPIKKLEQFEKDGGRESKILFRGATMPDNAFSVGPRLTPSEQDKIAKALLSPEGEKATAKLREKYGQGKPLVATSNKEFAGLSVYLKNEWGY